MIADSGADFAVLGDVSSGRPLKSLPVGGKLGGRDAVAEHVLFIEPAPTGDRQSPVLDHRNLIIVSESPVWRTILVGLLPCLSQYPGIGRNTFFFNER